MTKVKKVVKIAFMMQKTICPFFGRCGGCLYQDLPEDAYLNKKISFIQRSFADYGLDVHPESVRGVPLGSRRRVSFSFARGKVGYNAHKSHEIIEITECRLLRPEIVSFLPELKKWVQKLGGSGDIFILLTDWGLDILIKTPSQKLGLDQLELLAGFGGDSRVARLIYNDEPIVEKVKLPLKPNDFLQPSKEGEEILKNLLVSEVQTAHKAVDLFCGAGTFTKPLADLGVMVKGYDCSESVHLLGDKGFMRDLFRNPLLPEEMEGLDLIVLDPPRAGARAQVEQIAQTKVPKIVMVSCSPQTAARDSRILTDAGWRMTKLTPVDQFTWSNHIELVIVFEK